MTEVVVATLNVSFESTDSTTTGNLKLEIDNRTEGLNNGNTSFKPGDDAYYWLFKDSNVTVLEHICTAGGISNAGSDSMDIDENITFTNSDTSSLGYPPSGGVTMDWLGRSYQISGTTVSSNTSLPEVIRSELSMSNSKKVVGILRCRYTTTGTLHKLSGVPTDFKESMIIALGSIS